MSHEVEGVARAGADAPDVLRDAVDGVGQPARHEETPARAPERGEEARAHPVREAELDPDPHDAGGVEQERPQADQEDEDPEHARQRERQPEGIECAAGRVRDAAGGRLGSSVGDEEQERDEQEDPDALGRRQRHQQEHRGAGAPGRVAEHRPEERAHTAAHRIALERGFRVHGLAHGGSVAGGLRRSHFTSAGARTRAARGRSAEARRGPAPA